LTVDEWAALPEDEQGELVDGRLEEEEKPSFLHESVIAFLMFRSRARGSRGGASEAARLRTFRCALPGCAGLVIDLDALWAELDRLLAEAAES
jgi:hypothetical protein